MTSLHVGDTRAAEAVIDDAAMQRLREHVRGSVIRPGDDGYDDARKIWNGMIDRRPGLIVRCAGVSDVIDAVNFARATICRSPCVAAATARPATRCATAAW